MRKLIVLFIISFFTSCLFAKTAYENICISRKTSDLWRYSIGFLALYGQEQTGDININLRIFEKPEIGSKLVLYCQTADTSTFKPISEVYNQFNVVYLKKFPVIRKLSKKKRLWYKIIYDIEKDKTGWIKEPNSNTGYIKLFEGKAAYEMIFINTPFTAEVKSVKVYDEPRGKLVKKIKVPIPFRRIEIKNKSFVTFNTRGLPIKSFKKDWALIGGYDEQENLKSIGWIRIRNSEGALRGWFVYINRSW